jgi:hypothetical protein
VEKPSSKEIREKRCKAAIELLKICQTVEKEDYTALDFMLDRLLRMELNLPEKDLGRPPYEFFNN